MPRRPIHRASHSATLIRVGYRMVACDLRRNPDRYRLYPPQGIMDLADSMRMLWPGFYFVLAFFAKGVSQGHTMAELRDMDKPFDMRALHKRRLPRPTR